MELGTKSDVASDELSDEMAQDLFLLPEEVWQNIALNLSPVDLLSLLSVNRRLHYGLGRSVALWRNLAERDDGISEEENICNSTWQTEKYSYLFRCQKSDPSGKGGGVRWYPVRPYGPFAGIPEREGHVSCVFKRHALSSQQDFDSSLISSVSLEGSEERQERFSIPPQDRIVAITGGFCDDDSVYLINTGTGMAMENKMEDSIGSHRHHWATQRVDPVGRAPSFVYGSSLTALPTQYCQTTMDGETPQKKLTATMRAIRFGGFQSGGYSDETARVVMLTVRQDAVRVQKRRQQRRGKRDRERNDDECDDNDDSNWSNWEWHWNGPLEVCWTNLDVLGNDFLSRAYHTSTLLLDRYLVVIGGMKTSCSILNEAILDTKTWKWIEAGCITCASDDSSSGRPSGRHGHSVVLDDSRNRLVLFGGGSGSDLLRSGKDNSEVWELQLGENWREKDKLVESLPWKWKRIHSNDGNSGLSPSESLCLGRCHNGVKISRDTVLLFFGSGRPSTNGVLAYNLKSDTFFQQQPHSSSMSGAADVKGILPKPRFTAIAEFLEKDGYIITHGGYCSQDHETIGTMDVLDLAPGSRWRVNPSHGFNGLAIDDRRVSYEEVTDLQAEEGQRDPNAALQEMLQTLTNTPNNERQAVARLMMNEMRSGERPSNRQTLLLMTLIANGSSLIIGDDTESEDS